MNKREQSKLLRAVITQQGGVRAAAATLNVKEPTITRWRSGARPLAGAALVAVRAVLAHPEDYATYREQARPPGRPSNKE